MSFQKQWNTFSPLWALHFSQTLQPDPSISYKSTTFMTNEEMRSLPKKKKKKNDKLIWEESTTVEKIPANASLGINWTQCHSIQCFSADHEEEDWYWQEAVIHEWCYLSPWQKTLPHQFNTANHQINVHRHSPPPCKTNYVSILHCQVSSTLCLCSSQLVEESIKTSEGTVKEGQRQTGVKLRLLRQHQQAGGSGRCRCVCVWWLGSKHLMPRSEVPKSSSLLA